MKDLTFVTGNQHKVDFVSTHIGLPLAHHKLDLDEIQSFDLHKIVEHKARQAYDVLHVPVLVEDAGLAFTAMGRLPGVYIKWFLQEIGLEGLVQLARNLPEKTAVGSLTYGLYDGKELHFFDGEMRGRVADAVRMGTRGFGYDPIFINDGFSVSRAEMQEADYDRTSYRTAPLAALREFLTNH